MVVVIFLAETGLVAILFQFFSGYRNFEIGVYVVNYLYDYGGLFYLAIVLSVIVQIIVPNKYVGMLIMVVYIMALMSLSNAGFEDPLYLYGATSSTPYSDMNGYDGFLGNAAWYMLYWTCFATVLAVLGYALWSRGPLEKLRVRIRKIGVNLTRPAMAIAAIAGVGFLAPHNIPGTTHPIISRIQVELGSISFAIKGKKAEKKTVTIPSITIWNAPATM